MNRNPLEKMIKNVSVKFTLKLKEKQSRLVWWGDVGVAPTAVAARPSKQCHESHCSQKAKNAFKYFLIRCFVNKQQRGLPLLLNYHAKKENALHYCIKCCFDKIMAIPLTAQQFYLLFLLCIFSVNWRKNKNNFVRNSF